MRDIVLQQDFQAVCTLVDCVKTIIQLVCTPVDCVKTVIDGLEFFFHHRSHCFQHVLVNHLFSPHFFRIACPMRFCNRRLRPHGRFLWGSEILNHREHLLPRPQCPEPVHPLFVVFPSRFVRILIASLLAVCDLCLDVRFHDFARPLLLFIHNHKNHMHGIYDFV
nr:MAG TPA: hypothetical protein [Caudoviricetes sp.]